MKDKEITVTADELQKQKLYTADVAAIMQVRAMHGTPKALVRTYGCQQNVADGERMKGMLSEMGFEFTEDEDEADFILFNTCAIREHAEDRVFGNIGALKNVKRRNPSLLIAVCGCMMEQERVAERIKASFPFVNIVFGTHVIHRLPEMMYTAVTDSKRVFLRGHESKEIIEGLPVRRDGNTRAWVTVMYGCDNFCSYCIVPYVRGREKSRHPDAIVAECRELIEQGYKEITLLGQNVNSYGKGLPEKVNFSELLRRIDAIDGDYRLRFMTSHPKDATHELFDTIAESRHICHYIHLPCQSGSSRVLKA
ncbi:MAG: MiaB/RimO family radical SAM methylthiotransferase, partial [Hominenteromicrobium mulieris]